MSIGTVTRGRHRVIVEFDPALAECIATAITNGSTPYRKLTASDVIREAVARFLLPNEGTNGSVHATKTSATPGDCGEVTHADPEEEDSRV